MVADKEAPEEEKLQVQDGLSGVILPAGVEGVSQNVSPKKC